MTLKEATASELVQRKMDMDALRKRLGDTTTKQEKLRESCEGFEAIFLQKMWEQMRKTVPKEGFLHSKDEEMYQSLFDIELCKKMAGAGGIGLADMLYEQLAQQLENTGRTTSPGRYRIPLDVPPSENLGAFKTEAVTAEAPDSSGKRMTAEDLYSPLPEQDAEPESGEADLEANAPSAIDAALSDLKKELGLPPEQEEGAAVAEWAAMRAAMSGVPAEPSSDADDPNAGITVVLGNAQQAAPPAPESASLVSEPASSASEPASPGRTRAARRPENPSENDLPPASPSRPSPESVNPALLSWQGNGPVSAKPKPAPIFGKNRNRSRIKNAEAPASPAPASPATRGLAPQGSVWPLEGVVVSRFGWEDEPGTGKRHWNSGINIAAPAESPVRAILAGTVVYSGQREGHGNTVVLEHQGGYRSYYGNLDKTSLKVGDKVQHGANFAKIATQPSSSSDGENSASLYFEVKKGEMALNPESAIRRMETASR